MSRYLLVAVLLLALVAQGCGGSKAPLSFRAGDVTAVEVYWSPDLETGTTPKRTTDPAQFAPLLEELGQVRQVAQPPDLEGQPLHITLELKGGGARSFVLWSPYLADIDQERLYILPEDLYRRVTEALAPLQPPLPGAPRKLSRMITVADLVQALQEHGARDARETGEELPLPLFGAESGWVIEVLEQKVQVYVMASPEAAAHALQAYPQQGVAINWIHEPHFAAVGNLLITVVVPEPAVAQKILIYLEMLRA